MAYLRGRWRRVSWRQSLDKRGDVRHDCYMTKSNVIEVQFREETEADRMTGDIGDRFRTDAAQDMFRARFNVAQLKLTR